MLTQSLRFLELIIESGASSLSFLSLTFLALPRLFEIIFPIGLSAALLFIYNRMIIDSEMAVAQAAGWSPAQLARPGLLVATILSVLLFVVANWLAPLSLTHMQVLRTTIKAQYSSLLFREGVFNTVGPDVTVYVGERGNKGSLKGVLFYDQRPENPRPVTILARSGVIISTNEGNQVVVYDGSRQTFNEETGVLDRLHFDRYTLDLPDSGPIRQRFREPEERTLTELFQTNFSKLENDRMRRDFNAEIHRRFVSALLPLSFACIALCPLLLGAYSRRGQARKSLFAMGVIIILQGLYLAAFTMAQRGLVGILLMYFLALTPIIFGFLTLRNNALFFWLKR